jgi:hypothetical protein
VPPVRKAFEPCPSIGHDNDALAPHLPKPNPAFRHFLIEFAAADACPAAELIYGERPSIFQRTFHLFALAPVCPLPALREWNSMTVKLAQTQAPIVAVPGYSQSENSLTVISMT